MKITKIYILFFVFVLAGSVIVRGQSHNAQSLTAGGTEGYTGIIDFGTGFPPQPGGKIRGLTFAYALTASGPATGFLDGFTGWVEMNANLDENLTGPVWGTFMYRKNDMTWEGTWNGQYNWAFGIGSWKTEGHGSGSLKGLTLRIDSAKPELGPVDYFFATISGNIKD